MEGDIKARESDEEVSREWLENFLEKEKKVTMERAEIFPSMDSLTFRQQLLLGNDLLEEKLHFQFITVYREMYFKYQTFREININTVYVNFH